MARSIHHKSVIGSFGSLVLAVVILCAGSVLYLCSGADAAQGTVLCPIISGKPDKLPFDGHPGWLDVYGPGDSTGRYTKIGDDATYGIKGVSGPVAAIATFDHIELCSIVAPRFPVSPGNYDLEVWGDYICRPAGYPEVWDKEYMVRANDFYQTFIARSSQIYNISGWDGEKITWWGNKANTAVNEGGPDGPVILMEIFGMEKYEDHMTSHISDYSDLRTGFRHTDIPVTPGKRYAARVGGYRHGGQHKLDSFIRPDKGDGYPFGRAYLNGSSNPIEGDLCLIIQGNSNGQIVENQIRDEEWEILLPKRKPVKNWGQSFLNHGKSMAAVTFYATNGSEKQMSCKVRIREDGPEGKVISPTKTAISHDVTGAGPFYRYAQWPGPLEGYEHFYRIKLDPLFQPVPKEKENSMEAGYPYNSQVFQVAFIPDEVKLEPGKTYYVDLEFSDPVLVFVDGMFYPRGFGYYDGLEITQEIEQKQLFHSFRWTIAGSIVTYENPGGVPNR